MINDKEVTLEELKNKVKEFCEKRDWDQFHNPKELAIGISTILLGVVIMMLLLGLNIENTFPVAFCFVSGIIVL